jgi:hypothetical protein
VIIDALGDALGIVEPVDADDQLLAVEALQHALVQRGLCRPFRQRGEFFRLDADRIGPGGEDAPIGGKARSIQTGGEVAPRQAVGKVLAIMFGLETKHVIGGQARQKCLVHRHGMEDVRCRPGNVQEEADPVGHTLTAQLGGQRDEMIVVDPDQVVRLDERQEAACKEAVHAEVTGHLAPAIFGKVQPVVADRPEHPVCKALVVFLDIAFREVGEGVFDIALLLHLQRPDRIVRAGSAGPAEPEPAARFECRLKGDRQPSGRGGAALVGNGNAVGNDDETSHEFTTPLGQHVPLQGRAEP